ncbi:MAG: AAA family ATPase [Halodesulfurarchaeum sp.]
MESPLWIDTHAPSIEDVPQSSVRDRLWDAVDQPINLILHGPTGSGKTAAVRALADAAHADPENDLVEINVADFFGRTKKEIRQDPRFEQFLRGQTEFSKQFRRGSDKSNRYKSDWSKRDMIGHVLKEYAGYAPSSGEYKTILLDNAEDIREDFQQALRRVMERHHRTTQFVITTRQPAKLIPPIRSRCFPVSVRAPTEAETVSILRSIAETEDVTYDEEGLSYVASYAEGDLRKAILAAQTAAEKTGGLSGIEVLDPLQDVGLGDRIDDMLEAAETGSFTDARSILDDLLVDEGLTGEEVLREILETARTRYNGDRLAELTVRAGEVSFDLNEGTADRIHLSRLLAEVQSA